MASVEFYELDGSPEEDVSGRKFVATRRLLVRWADRYALRAALLGHPGATYPYLNDWTIRCTGVSIQPFGGIISGGGGSSTSYEWALVIARYETPDVAEAQPFPANLNPQLYMRQDCCVSESLEPTLQAERLDYRAFRWKTLRQGQTERDPLRPDEAPVRELYRIQYSMTRHYQVAFPPEALELLGKINDRPVRPVLLAGIEFPKHTLLYCPPSISASVNDAGVPTIDITYRFMFRPETWRKYWRPDLQDYDSIVTASGEDYEVPAEGDFRVLYPR